MQDICIRRNGFNLLKIQVQRYHRLKRWPCCDSLNSFLCTFYLKTSNRMYLIKELEVQFLCFCDLLQSNTKVRRPVYISKATMCRCFNTQISGYLRVMCFFFREFHPKSVYQIYTSENFTTSKRQLQFTWFFRLCQIYANAFFTILIS